MEALTKFVASALGKPSTDPAVSLFVNQLEILGVETIEDLQLLSESDLKPLTEEGITIIQIRKVCRACEGEFSWQLLYYL